MIDKIFDLDKSIFLDLNFDGGYIMDNIMWYFSWIGSYVIMVIFFLLLMKYHKRISYKDVLILILFMGLIVLLCDQTSNFFKSNLPKFRPTHNPSLEGMIHTVRGYVGGLYGTVSGHACNGFGLATFISLVYSRRPMTIFVMLYVATISYSRIYLGVHFPLDLIFGTLFGIFYGWCVYKLYNIYNTRTIKNKL